MGDRLVQTFYVSVFSCRFHWLGTVSYLLCCRKENYVQNTESTMVLVYCYLRDYNTFIQKFHIGLPKMHGRIRIGLPKVHGRIHIGLLKVHVSVLGHLRFPMQSAPLDFHSRVIPRYHSYYARKTLKCPI